MTQRDIRKRFDEIVAFSEVEQFLDTPVKRYSSGMYVRLAFAVAAHLEPGSWDLLEALQPDPTRTDALTWITSYDTLYNTPGVPLVDFKPIGKSGRDPRMLFSWYSADLCTDLAFTGLAPEQRGTRAWARGPMRDILSSRSCGFRPASIAGCI